MARSVTITGQYQTTARGPAGGYIDVVRVSFTVDKHGPFHVDVPTSSYTVDAVKSAVAQYAETVGAVAQLDVQ